jgi:hypothetical protein
VVQVCTVEFIVMLSRSTVVVVVMYWPLPTWSVRDVVNTVGAVGVPPPPLGGGSSRLQIGAVESGGQ